MSGFGLEINIIYSMLSSQNADFLETIMIMWLRENPNRHIAVSVVLKFVIGRGGQDINEYPTNRR
jgi:hypothetical protein